MNKLISLILGFAFVLFLPAPSMAQMGDFKNTTPEERAQKLTSTMQSDLSLDEETTKAVSEINLKYAKEAQTVMDSSGTQFGKAMTFRKNEQAKDAELKGVLSPEQYSQYEEKKSAMRDTMKQKFMEKRQAAQ
ncbi:Uncharacterised protein [Halioglobus japonicus]|nr:Uncharacterised protein [Halioglobus japonicus]